MSDARVPFRYTTLQDVQTRPDASKPLAFDSETDGLYGKIALAQFYQTGWPEVLLVVKPNVLELATFLTSMPLVLHNAAYDFSVIQRQGAPNFRPGEFEDTLFLSRLAFYKDEEHSLDQLFLRVLGYDPYLGQGLDKKVMQKSNWAGVLSYEQGVYAATDVYYLPQVYETIKSYKETISYRLDIVTLRHCLNFQNNGLCVDEGRRSLMEMEAKLEIEAMNMPININSWQQVRPYIGEDESDALALIKFALTGNDKARDVLTTRKATKKHSFLKKFKTSSDYIYGLFSPSARSGRLTCKEQNLQQLPRSTKKVFGFPANGDKVIVYADFSQLELRCACAIVGERNMERLFRNGEDLHQYTADMLKIDRQIAKTANFNLLYGGSAGMLMSILLKQAEVYVPEEELKVIRNRWLKLWPAIDAWQKQCVSDWRHNKADQTALGRRYVGKLMTDQMNIKVQGSGAEVAKVAFNNIMKGLPLIHEQALMMNFIHDSYLIECPNDPAVYKAVADLVGMAMHNAWLEVSKYFVIKDLPNPVNVKVGYNWGDIEKGVSVIHEAIF